MEQGKFLKNLGTVCVYTNFNLYRRKGEKYQCRREREELPEWCSSKNPWNDVLKQARRDGIYAKVEGLASDSDKIKTHCLLS